MKIHCRLNQSEEESLKSIKTKLKKERKTKSNTFIQTGVSISRLPFLNLIYGKFH